MHDCSVEEATLGRELAEARAKKEQEGVRIRAAPQGPPCAQTNQLNCFN